MQLDKEIEFLDKMKEDGILSKEFHFLLQQKVHMIESHNLNFADLIVLTHIMKEEKILKYYNKFASTNLEPVLHYSLNVDRSLEIYMRLDKKAIMLKETDKDMEIAISEGDDLNRIVRDAELIYNKKIIAVRSLKVSYLKLTQKLTGNNHRILLSFDEHDKAKIILIDAINSYATDVHIGVKHKEGIPYCSVDFRIASELEKWDRFKLSLDDNYKVICSIVGRSAQSLISGLGLIEGIEDAADDLIGDGNWFARISASPCRAGYELVIRLHELSKAALAIDQLGFVSNIEEKIRSISKKESGLILVSGKTGSGKNTTVYAMLNETLTFKNLKVVEFSNPIEVLLDCVQKSFRTAEQLNTLVRRIKKEDPDIVFVGEIADKTTGLGVRDLVNSNICVYTTTHFDRVWDFPYKIFDLYGNEYTQIISKFNSVINQVMFKRLCPHCRSLATENSKLELEFMGRLGVTQHFISNIDGCDKCRKGYLTRPFPQAEILEMNDEIVSLVMKLDSPVEMKMALKKYCINNYLDMESIIAPLVESGQIDLIQVERRGLCK